MFDLNDKVVLITGAASGIGRETSIILSRYGARLILLDISELGLRETLGMMSGDNHVIAVVDLSDIDSLKVVPNIIESVGKISGLVHCAGISSRKPLNVLTRNGFNKLMDVNFYSFVELVKITTKKKYFEDGGSIVVISSISSIKGYKAKTEYCVSKAAIDAFVRCMALELADRRIKVNSIMPAVVKTPMALNAMSLNSSLGVENVVSPLGYTEPAEVANVIAFLLSNLIKTITGTSILIDGGITI